MKLGVNKIFFFFDKLIFVLYIKILSFYKIFYSGYSIGNNDVFVRDCKIKFYYGNYINIVIKN